MYSTYLDRSDLFSIPFPAICYYISLPLPISCPAAPGLPLPFSLPTYPLFPDYLSFSSVPFTPYLYLSLVSLFSSSPSKGCVGKPSTRHTPSRLLNAVQVLWLSSSDERWRALLMATRFPPYIFNRRPLILATHSAITFLASHPPSSLFLLYLIYQVHLLWLSSCFWNLSVVPCITSLDTLIFLTVLLWRCNNWVGFP